MTGRINPALRLVPPSQDTEWDMGEAEAQTKIDRLLALLAAHDSHIGQAVDLALQDGADLTDVAAVLTDEVPSPDGGLSILISKKRLLVAADMRSTGSSLASKLETKPRGGSHWVVVSTGDVRIACQRPHEVQS